jgi:hypothetical protein
MLNRVSLEWGSLRVTGEISQDLKVVVGEERTVHSSQMSHQQQLKKYMYQGQDEEYLRRWNHEE